MSYQRRKKGEVKASISIRLSEELLAQIDQAAEDDNRTRSAWLAALIDEKLKECEGRIAAEPNPPYRARPIEFPIMCLGSVAAGSPVADEDPEAIMVPVDYTGQPGHYALRVNGHSMEPEIPDGAIIIVKEFRGKGFPRKGSIVVYSDGEGSTLKRFTTRKDEDGNRQGVLESLNPEFPGVEPMDGGEIQAVLVEVVE